MWIGYQLQKDDFTLPVGAPGHLQPEEGSAGVHKCAGVVIRSGGKFLLIKRVENGVWEQPGGHIDPGETAEQGAARETKEEAGITVGKIKQIKNTVSDKVDYTTFLWDAPTQLTPTLSAEHTDWGWFSLDKLPKPTSAKVEATLRSLTQKADLPMRNAGGGFASSPGGIVGSWKSKDHPVDPKTGYPEANEKMPQPVQDLMAKVQKLPTGKIGPGAKDVASRSPFPVELGKQTAAEKAAIEHAVGTGDWKLVNVPISQITTRQPWIKGPQVIKMTGLDHSKMDDADRYGTAIQAPDGHYILLDGNHAAALARLTGQNSVKLRVLNFKA